MTETGVTAQSGAPPTTTTLRHLASTAPAGSLAEQLLITALCCYQAGDIAQANVAAAFGTYHAAVQPPEGSTP